MMECKNTTFNQLNCDICIDHWSSGHANFQAVIGWKWDSCIPTTIIYFSTNYIVKFTWPLAKQWSKDIFVARLLEKYPLTVGLMVKWISKVWLVESEILKPHRQNYPFQPITIQKLLDRWPIALVKWISKMWLVKSIILRPIPREIPLSTNSIAKVSWWLAFFTVVWLPLLPIISTTKTRTWKIK